MAGWSGRWCWRRPASSSSAGSNTGASTSAARRSAFWRSTGTGRRHALLLGLHHGLFCVGCCWAIMLLMFVVGTGNVAWMLGLGALMALEKNAPWGRRMSRPLGGALVALAGMIAIA